jgi:phospholipid/cholesterol/gamma-HCH transport system permease protein
MADEGWIEARQDGAALALAAGGRWLVSSAAALDRRLAALDLAAPVPVGVRRVRIDCAQIAALDTVGAWLVLRLKAALRGKGAEVTIENLAPRFAPLLSQAEKYDPAASHAIPRAEYGAGPVDMLARLGRASLAGAREVSAMLGFFGLVVITSVRVLRHPGRIRYIAFVSHIQRTGVSALPIVGLLSFLIGIVITYQGADQLRYFGAEVFTVNLLGIGFLRELGVLMTAIIVAGRSGSAFTAEIGTMRVNEEVDAMTTLGLDPVEVLVLPRMAALVVALPLLTFYANMVGLVGGAFICDAALGIPLPLFLQQLRTALTGWSFWLGILKAPFFALCIAIIGCREGLRVGRSAESVGRLTTLSVVESIFLVIVVDAAFSVLFAQLRI